jgi:hypothetical protein
MNYVGLIVAAVCAFAAALGFKGTTIDAILVGLAVANFGLFIHQ